MTTCVLPAASRHSPVKGPFLSCSAHLIVRAGVRCTACVRARERAVSDYGGKLLLHVYPCHMDNNPFQYLKLVPCWDQKVFLYRINFFQCFAASIKHF